MLDHSKALLKHIHKAEVDELIFTVKAKATPLALAAMSLQLDMAKFVQVQ